MTEPLFLAAAFLAFAMLGSTLVIVILLRKPLRAAAENLVGIRHALEADDEEAKAQERNRVAQAIGDAVHDMGRSFAEELDDLGAAGGLERTNEGTWQRRPTPPPTFAINPDLTDAAIGSVQLVTEHGFQAAFRERVYAPLPIVLTTHESNRIASEESDENRNAIWNFIVWYIDQSGFKGQMPWQPHPHHRGTTWYAVVRTELIEQCGWALMLDIERQFPPLKAYDPYVAWKRQVQR
ncbi:MAG TPA: hypothetical protein VM581_04940 [Magnetospirillaceae bacterium]|nr:hypothetical protein [Magnetospirillaceae bacterium]